VSGSFQLLEREGPLARLEAAIGAARRGRGRIVSLEGEAGIGKSALTLAFVDACRGDVRAHVGGCEHLTTPEPLGPLRDIARESQGRFTVSPLGSLATYEGLLRLLTGGKGPALLVLEDIHWADDATLDALRFLGRRIRTAPVMVLVTFRNDEPESQARLASLWTDMPRDARERIELEPLSLEAVGQLALREGRVAREVYEATGGNPFHITEYLASDGEGRVPRSVQEMTVARAGRLSAHARRTLECASIFPRQIDEQTLLQIVSDADHAGVEECLASGMLNAREGALAFRHELARRAINEAMSPLHRRELHAAALALLRDRGSARAAEVAHHAEQAGATDELTLLAIRAAQEAGSLGAYREAVAHLTRAIEHGHGLSDGERAQLLERKAFAAHFCGAFSASIGALEDAIAMHRRADSITGVGNALRISGHVYWALGDPDMAEAHLEEAVDVLSAEPDSWQYAMALASQAQFDALADRNSKALPAAEEALARAQKLGRRDIAMMALTCLHTTRSSTDLDAGLPALLATIEEARRLDELDALPRLYTNLTSVMTSGRRYHGLLQAFDDGIAACAARDQAPLEAYIRGNRATALLDMGRLADAVTDAEDVIHGPYPKTTVALSAMIALSRARVRLGQPEGGVLDQARKLPTSQRDLLRRVPIAIADAEAHWLDGSRPDAPERLAEVLDQVVRAWSQLWNIGEAALWLAILGRRPALSPAALAQLPEAHRAHIEGRWRDAARLWADRGCPYEQAIALSEGDEDAQRQALAIFDGLGAAPAARKLRRRMRAEGVRSVPNGPRAARRADPAGLTPRQKEVLLLLGGGLANADIADQLGLSAKTVEHHVSAILAALEAPSRLAAVQIARERGLHQVD
jgi:DNA-binding CsgD family transcriptional regulator/tetratricopeptide (TPR) repeat protein